MQFTIEKDENYVLFKLKEEKLNTLISADLKSELLIVSNQGYTNFIIDLGDVKYCDSSGLSAILVGHRICRNANGSFVLTGLNESVLKLIKISHLDQVLVITPTISEAIDFVFMDQVAKKIKDE